MSEKVYRSELTPVDFLRRSAYMFPDKTAVVYGERRYTYGELEERVNRLVSRLRDAGLQKGDRVAFLCPNTPPMLEGHFGVPAAGMVLVAINTRLGKDEVSYIVEHSGAKLIFVEDRKSTRLNSSHANISYAVFCLKKKNKVDYF